MNYLSLFSGIEAASVAWKPLGWRAVGFSEIEKFPCAVLSHHCPDVPNFGDVNNYKSWNINERIDLVCGGSPCQSFSVAGLRKGMDDPRGNLSLVFLGAVDHFRPRWVVWENVPGVLSSNRGRDFGSFLGALGQLGYGFAYRVLDAQYFGLAQRRKRVFVVGYLGDWRPAAAVLFERHGFEGHPAPRRGKGEGVTGTLKACASSGGWSNSADHAAAGLMVPVEVAHTLRGEGFDASEDGTGRGVPLVMAHGQANAEVVSDGEPSLTCNHEAPILIAQSFHENQRGEITTGDVAGTLKVGGGKPGQGYPAVCVRMREGKEGGGKGPLVSEDQSLTLATANDQVLCTDGVVGAITANMTGCAGTPGYNETEFIRPTASMQVRRLTPVETLRLQGFPDNYLDIIYRGKPAADGPKYKAVGNSWAVPVVRWIGNRITMVEELITG